MKKITFLLLSSALLTSCTSWHVQEACNQTNWYELGRRAGNLGLTNVTNSDKKQMQHCLRYDVKPDYKSYESGLQAGLVKYCSIENAQLIGQQGQAFKFQSCYSNKDNLVTAHQQGVLQFCKTSGFKTGLANSLIEVECPKELEDKFNSEFQKGRSEYMVQSMQSVKSQLNEVSNELRQLRQENSQLKNQNSNLERQNRNLQQSVNNLETQLRHSR